MPDELPSVCCGREHQCGWYVVVRDRAMAPVRGPYRCSHAAAAVRDEMERDDHWDRLNLWVQLRHGPDCPAFLRKEQSDE